MSVSEAGQLLHCCAEYRIQGSICSGYSECSLCNLPCCFVLLRCRTDRALHGPAVWFNLKRKNEKRANKTGLTISFLLVRRLSAPLTPAKRSRDRRLDGASQGGSTLASPSQRLKTDTTAATSQSGAAAAAKAAAEPMPGDDLPPVLAPPGRSAVTHVFLPAWHSRNLPLTCNIDLCPALFNPKTYVLVQKRHPYARNLRSETPGDSKNAFLH